MARRSTELISTLFASVKAETATRRLASNADKVAALLASMQPHQRRLEADRSRWVSVISPRQTGKSTGVMLLVTLRCEQVSGAEWVVIGLTRPSVKRIYWSSLKKLNELLELGIKFNDQELIARFPNGSCIYFVGGETISEIEKLRGGRYDGVVVDEGKSYAPHVLATLLDEILQPALNTKRGTLYLIGSPGDDLKGPFYLATCQPAEVLRTPSGERLSNRLFGQPGTATWSLHVWTLKDNAKVPWLWTDALALKERNGWADDHPVWMREYLGKWVAAGSRLVFRYYPHRHDYHPTGKGRFGLPEGHTWTCIIGQDLGSVDGTGLVIWAQSPTHPGLWEVYSEKRRREDDKPLNVGTVAAWFHELDGEYGPFDGAVSDHLPLVLDTLANEHGVYFEPAEKREKPEAIELFNADLDRGLIHIKAGSALSEELAGNKWDEKALARGKREEDRNTPNDLTDAGLYAWRFAAHRRAKAAAEAPPQPGTPRWLEAEMARDLAAARDRARRSREPDFSNLDREWWDVPL